MLSKSLCIKYYYNHYLLLFLLLLGTLYMCLWHAVMANDPRNLRSGCVRHLGMTHYIIKYTILSSYRCRSYNIIYYMMQRSIRHVISWLYLYHYDIYVFSRQSLYHMILYNHFILDIPQPMCVINRIQKHKYSQTSLFTQSKRFELFLIRLFHKT